MSAEVLLSRLDGVRRTGRETWLARCPAHEDRSPSLSVRELGDGRVLVHDFAGCSVDDVLAAVGLDFDALFPPRAVDDHRPRERQPFPAADVLRAIAREALIVATAAGRIGTGAALSDEDRQRVIQAGERLFAAQELLEDRDARGMTTARRHDVERAARVAEEDLADA